MTGDFVTTTVNYGVPPADGTRAWNNLNANSSTGKLERNWGVKSETVQIENLRGKEGAVTLDTAGFQFFVRPSKFKDFNDDGRIKEEYYAESGVLIKEITGASKVVFFDHTIRRNRPGFIDDSPEKRQPIQQAHVDQTTASSIARVHRHLPPAEAPQLLQRRFQIINLWRPIEVPAFELPLALCDYRSVDSKTDAFPVALIYPDREGETLGIQHNPNHRWKYLKGMTPDEFVLIKCFDSIDDGSVAVFSPHTAFPDPTTQEGAPARQSIELRALVFYD